MAMKLTKCERTLFVDDGAKRGPMTIVRLKFHPTLPYLFAQVVDRRLAVWDLTAEPQKLKKGTFVVGELVCGHAAGWVRGFDVHPDGESLVTGGSDRRLKRWRWADGKSTDAPDVDVAAHDGWVEAVAYSPDGRQVATCGADRNVKLWNSNDLSLLKTLDGHRGYVRDVAYRPDGRQLASAGEDGAVIVWDAATGETLRTIDFGDVNDQQGQTPAVPGAHRLAVSADGRWLAVAGGQKTVMYDLESGSPVASDKLRLQVAFHPSAPLLAAGEDTLKVWDCQVDAWKPPAVDDKGKPSAPGPIAGRELASIKRGEYSHGIAFSPAGLRMAVGRSDGTVELWDIES